MRTARASSLRHLATFLVAATLWVLGFGIAVAVAMLLLVPLPPGPIDGLALLGATGLGVTSIVQIAGLALLGAALATRLPVEAGAGGAPPTADTALDRIRATYPLATPIPLAVAALVAGTLIWTMPTWIAQELSAWFDYQSTPELLMELLGTAPLAGRVAIGLAMVVSAPLFEELVFRGYLWRVIAHGGGPIAAWAGTTALFALFHLDPVHAVALLPTAAFLGWLRLRSGSLIPPMLAHFANNAFGVVVGLTASADAPDTPLGLGVAVLGLAATIAIGAIGAWFSRRASL
ncbi:MAG: CPBP family intramembrane glutamic endopeptidase [Myxococcota bacterium]